MNRACNSTIFLAPRYVEGSNIIKFQLQSQSQKIFIANFACVLTNISFKIYQMGFPFYRLGHACPRGETLGHWGVQGVKNNFEHGHVAYHIDGDDEQNRMPLIFSP